MRKVILSRTINTMPYRVRKYAVRGIRAPKGINSTTWTQRPKKDTLTTTYNAWIDRTNEIDWLDDPWNGGSQRLYGNDVPARFRRDLNRAYRAKSRQALRDGRFDAIERPVRNARWLWS